MKTYEFVIEGLDCAMCAQSIQKKLLALDWVESAAVNFITSKISVATLRSDDVFDDVKKIVFSVDAEVKVTRAEEKLAENKKTAWYKSAFLWSFVSGAVVGTIGVILGYINLNSILSLVLICIGAALMLVKTLIRAVVKAVKGHSIDENLLVTISVVGAIAINARMEGLMVIFLYQIGKFLEAKAVDKTRRDLDELLKIKPTFVRLKTSKGITEVPPESVPVGSTVEVYAGDAVALDGVVISGSGSLNMSSLTGESAPVAVGIGSEVMSGAINVDGVLTLKTTSSDSDSTITKILNLVESASERKTKTETFVARGAKYYTAIVIVLALFVGLMFGFVGKIGVNESIYRGMIFLVISCPCAIAISVPLSYFSGIGNASKKGILVKGSNYLDSVANLKYAVFDKTGTLTTGDFSVTEVVSESEAVKDDILYLAAVGEQNSTHPIAKAIVKAYSQKADLKSLEKAQSVKETAGRGITFKAGGREIFVGRAESSEAQTSVDVKADGKLLGKIYLKDQIKENAKETVEFIQKKGIETYMFTGDNRAVANAVAAEIGIENVKSEMLPQDKFSELEKILGGKRKNEMCAFLGDGINDAPVLARSDIGIAMGLSGSNATIDTADVVFMNDDLNKLPILFSLAKFTRKIVKENLVFSLGVKLLFMILGTVGITGMAWAVVADVGLTLCTIFNSIRVLKMK